MISRVNHKLALNCLKLTPNRLAIFNCGNSEDSNGLIGIQKRHLRKWRRALPFPPDYNHHHHFFLPSLSEYIAEQEALTNPVQLIDIGYNEKDFFDKVKATANESEEEVGSKRREKQAAKKLTIESASDLVKLVDIEKEKKPLSYERLQADWGLSREGKEAVFNLAHHYQVYRDLFSSPSQAPYNEKPLPNAKLPQFHPPDDHVHTEVLVKWFPGSQPLEKPKPRPIYFFTPHVPIYAEFQVPESRIATEDDDLMKPKSAEAPVEGSVISTPVYRGNVIRPLYASERPNIVIDARGSSDNQVSSYFDAVDVDQGIKLITNSKTEKVGYYTLALFNLDTQLGDDKAVCHWMVSNITKDQKTNKVQQDETMSYLPVYGFRGFGYHRYAFVVYQHDEKLNLTKVEDFVLKNRQIDPLNLGQTEESKPKPVGLSWFQATWDSYSQKVLHNVLNMRAPVYEYVERQYQLSEQRVHPFLAPFNLYLDQYRDRKEFSKEALVERLKKVDPFNYKSAYEVDPIPNAPYLPHQDPSWSWSTTWKKRNKFGHWRMLRPASMTRPLNNNADLDNPFWPNTSRLDVATRYPDGRRRPKPIRETKWARPAHEHPTYRIDHNDFLKERKEEESKE